MSFRSRVTMAILLTGAPFGLLAAQMPSMMVTDSVPVNASAPEQAAPATAPMAPIAEPHASPLFQKEAPAAPLGSADRMAASSGGSNHTFVLSTLAIVLIAVLLAVLLF